MSPNESARVIKCMKGLWTYPGTWTPQFEGAIQDQLAGVDYPGDDETARCLNQCRLGEGWSIVTDFRRIRDRLDALSHKQAREAAPPTTGCPVCGDAANRGGCSNRSDDGQCQYESLPQWLRRARGLTGTDVDVVKTWLIDVATVVATERPGFWFHGGRKAWHRRCCLELIGLGLAEDYARDWADLALPKAVPPQTGLGMDPDVARELDRIVTGAGQ